MQYVFEWAHLVATMAEWDSVQQFTRILLRLAAVVVRATALDPRAQGDNQRCHVPFVLVLVVAPVGKIADDSEPREARVIQS